jgi:hypothetical protein
MNSVQQVVVFWKEHGTKFYGYVGTAMGLALTANAVLLAQSPPMAPLFSPRTMILLGVVYTAISGGTIQRGTANTKAIAAQVATDQAAKPQGPAK